MDKPKLIILSAISFFLGMAIAGAGAASYFHQDYLSKSIDSNVGDAESLKTQSENLEDKKIPKPPVSIIVAGRNLEAGNYLNDFIVMKREISEEYNASYYVPASDYEERIKGKRLNRKLRAGDPILHNFVD